MARRSAFFIAGLAGTLLLTGSPRESRGFKIDTHVWIAQQVLNDVLDDGDVTIPEFGEFHVSPAAVTMLALYANAYRMGSTGPDAFPDMVGGQMTVHPGMGWPTDQWLEWLMTGASNARERAFALGFATHAAGDIFAHTYINSYAGEIFNLEDLMDGMEEELRHIALEEFIKEHTPPIYDVDHTPLNAWSIVSVPPEFVRDRLILNPQVADHYRSHPATMHLALMYDFYATLNNVVLEAQQAKNVVNNGIQNLIDEIDDIEDQIDSLSWTCIFDLCATYVTLKASLNLANNALSAVQVANDIAADSVLAPLVFWRNQVREAVRQYVVTSQEIARELMSSGDPQAPLNDWLCEWAPTFAAVPSVVTLPGCAAADVAGQVTGAIDDLCATMSGHLEELGWALCPMQSLKALIEDDLKDALGDAAIDITAALTGPNSAMVSLLELTTNPIDSDLLDQEFAHDSSSKQLLLIDDLADRVEAEMHLDSDSKFSPDEYRVAYNAIILSKLLLLGPDELNRMVAMVGIEATAYGEDLYYPTSPFSVLFGGVKNIDGSHQWQEYALPYPRRGGAPDSSYPHDRSYGYAFEDGGFRLWQDCAARERVFETIFDGPLAPGIEAPASLGMSELLPANSPFRPTDNEPFPLASASTIVDAVAPIPNRASLPRANGECNKPVTKPPKATDYCQGEIVGTTTDPLLYPEPGDYSITWRYDDGQGNRSSQTQQVRVVDHEPPVLVIPPHTTVEQTDLDGTPVRLADAVATDNCAGPVAVEDNRREVYPLGTTVVTYRGEDVSGNVRTATTRVTVRDTTAPVFANVPAPVTVEQETLAGTVVPLSRPTASDICDVDPKIDDDRRSIYPLGTTTVHFTATDDSGNQGVATTRVVVEDTIPPDIESVTPSTSTLWPPNHAMIPVQVSVVVTDICDLEIDCQIVDVASNEPVEGLGDGDASPDWLVISDLGVELRAERAGTGTGRMYSVTVRCTDDSGNSSDSVTTVTVAHDEG